MNPIPTAARIALSVAVSLCAALPAHAADRWDWMVGPYLWAAGVSTDLQTRTPPSSSSSDTRFSGIVDKLDGAFEVHVEGQNDRFGMFADFTYLGLGDGNEHPRFTTKSDLDARLFDLAAVWNPGEGRFTGLDVYAGLRYIDVDLTLQLHPVNPAFDGVVVDGGATFNDFLLGARYTWSLSERWGLTLRGDGSFGDTEGTWLAAATAQYRMNNGAWVFGYRYLDVEIDNGNATTGIAMSGPLVGYGFRF